MWRVKTPVEGFSKHLQYVDCCPNQPVPGKALCEEHCIEASAKDIPSDLKEFTSYLAINGE